MTRILFSAAVAACLSVSAAAPAVAEPGDAMVGLADAQAIAGRAQQAAIEKGLNMAIVVVNREGRVILSYRMDGSSFINLALAEKKAATAAAIGAPTSILEQVADSGKPSLLSVPGAALVGGGVPIMRGDRIVGGIGVSGGSAQDDEAVAKSGLDAAAPGAK
ncbi:heme-binding protein [Sphingopyxis sp. J-6]|uniref:heme-binding protein n=1 Tax=Sphingopyxis sp. J-6 TaxID=3122054 RepID=UPI003984595D